MTPPWFRLSIDVDHDGNVRGASYEVRQEDRLVGIYVGPEPGPFTSLDAIVSELMEHVTDRYGVQLRLL